MASYTIQINETQRRIIEHALELYIKGGTKHCIWNDELVEGDLHAYSTVFEEGEALHTMTKDLPDQEAADPGILHGLCL